VTNVCFSPNGRYVLAFNLDSCIRLWDYIPHPSTVKKTYQGHRNAGFSIGGCFGTSPGGGSFVASASEDGDVVLWDVRSKDIVQRLPRVHNGVCFWVDVCGSTMVSCGKDGRIVVFRDSAAAAAAMGDDANVENGKAKGEKNGHLAPNGHDVEESTEGSTYHTPQEVDGDNTAAVGDASQQEDTSMT
jgi:COMPASS component SWD3